MYINFNRVIIVFALFILSGCLGGSSLEQSAESGIGLSINVLKEIHARPNSMAAYNRKIGWKETTYTLENGNWIYVTLYREARKNRYIHWEVNPEGIIVDSTIKDTPYPPAKK